MAEWRKIERDVRDMLGEGTLWSARDNAVYWVDILAPALNRLSLADGSVERWDMPEPIGWVVENAAGDLIGGFQSGFGRISADRCAVHHIAVLEPHFPGNRMNDGKADRHGAIWCGTMDMAEEEARGSLYRLDPDGTWQVMDRDYMVPNGPAFSACGRWLYHSDTAKRTVYRFAITDKGIARKESFIQFGEDDGFPDGMTVDREGYLWVAHWDGGRISRYDPDGELDRAIDLPARRITNITFAGEALDRMFVTSAAIGLPESEFDGALFEVESGVTGMPTAIYGG
ncbi:SMP-30/gluconolactonase/LRE family protein [Novosphingobium album (ex Hu et al. 2023)]|uniref:SMP-30/gluconolactonase/LRE family protein n=1 Tax=Novosphingobium album (ex Hu et al. 2023) TaxID=2930093 RepID=A0ABT0B3N9_9SPHN|nr:SMP-30/gluconolactonase/LRE family protein [Novosphingobium album (ex Hu et al. 2023)]MCJ2179667.1 SMP-30/gluconolactonase/LRE family protein [Novosphingobium album (ex Hu et al. 2023)]